MDDKIKKNKRTQPPNIFEYGKIQPQAIDLEESVLGAMMLERGKLFDVIDLLKPEIFYKNEHQLIFKSIAQLFSQNKNVDILTVTEQLKYNGELDKVGGPYYIATLTNRVVSSANIMQHSYILIQKFISRDLIRISSEIIHDAYEDTIDELDLLEKAEKEILSLRMGSLKRTYDHISVPVNEYLKSISEGINGKGRLLGIPSGFPDIDRTTGGWQKSDLIIIASRPSMGKTALALTFARNAAMDFNKKVGFFSLEMSKEQLTQRLISQETKIKSNRLRNYELDPSDITEINLKAKEIINAKLYIDDTPALSIFEFQAKARRMVSIHKVELVIVDYLQLMKGSKDKRGNREQEISEISQALKATAKELNIPVIALSQLSRQPENRSDKRPILSDLRESGAIEQDADIVIFPFRPAYYMKENETNFEDFKEDMEINIAKHRNGATRSDIVLRFIAPYTKITEYVRVPS